MNIKIKSDFIWIIFLIVLAFIFGYLDENKYYMYLSGVFSGTALFYLFIMIYYRI